MDRPFQCPKSARKTAPARGTNWGRHQSDVMGHSTPGRLLPSDPGNIGSQTGYPIIETEEPLRPFLVARIFRNRTMLGGYLRQPGG